MAVDGVVVVDCEALAVGIMDFHSMVLFFGGKLLEMISCLGGNHGCAYLQPSHQPLVRTSKLSAAANSMQSQSNYNCMFPIICYSLQKVSGKAFVSWG